MENIAPKSDSIIHAVVHEATRILEDARYCYAGHAEEARRWARVQLVLGIPTAIIAAFAGLTALSNQNNQLAIFGSYSSLVVGILAILVALMSGLSTFLDPKGKTMENEKRSAEYFRLMMEARSFAEIECLRSNNVEVLQSRLKQLQDKLNELNSQILVISAGAQRVIEKRLKKNKYDYEVDIKDENKRK